ncbi:MAG TPA: TAT-variant-translocated molybdopterin oxidoreductase [Pyrinomonadaceae bacterium]|nr:TAT-variant-translocated molybdopterin oxidoreductase [Pyrinomonadaceae bacterium]
MHIKDTLPELYKIRRPRRADEVRKRLESKRGREYWQSLEELADSEEFEELLHREFPQHASEWDDSTDRRTFLKLMGASLALAGLSGCSYQPPETIVPYVQQPEGLVPGKPLFFATAMPAPGGAMGLLARSNMGRPTKVEGNPDHPASGGGTDVFAQASVLTLYDPDRSQTVVNRGEVRSYTAFLADVNTALVRQLETGGAGLRFLTQTILSPTLAAQFEEVLRRFPRARVHQWEAAGANAAAGARLAFGDFAGTVYRFDRADRILSLDSDFLSCGPASLRYARDFANRRRVREGMTGEINRLYAVETTPTNTGMVADHRLSVRPGEMEQLARALAAGSGVTQTAGGVGLGLAPEQTKFIEAVVADLKAHAGRSIVIAGDEQPAFVHALAHAMNSALGNVGQTVVYTAPVEAAPADHVASLRELVEAIDGGQVELLVVMGGNPVYDTPVDLKLDADRLARIKVRTPEGERDGLRVHLSLYEDETSELCHWHVPEAHFLEAWGDTRAYDGTVSIIQPLIAPLYNGKSAHEFLAAFSERPDRTGYDIVREFWQTRLGGASAAVSLPANPLLLAATAGRQQTATAQAPGSPPPQQPPPPTTSQTGVAPPSQTAAAAAAPVSTPSEAFERAWRKALHDGVVPGTTAQERSVSVRADFVTDPAGQRGAFQTAAAPNTFEIVFRADPCVYDGRFANNGWLQELPKPLTKLTWDNAAIVSPATAERLNLGVAPDGALVEPAPSRVNRFTAKGGELIADVLELRYKGRIVKAPALIVPGQPDGVITVHLGYGRWRSGRVGGNRDNPVGFNAYELRASDAMWQGAGLEVAAIGEQFQLATTQIHFRMEGRDIVRSGSFEDYKHHPEMHPPGVHAAEGEALGSMYVEPHPGAPSREGTDAETMYTEPDKLASGEDGTRGYRWGMAIDLGTCVGCNACVVACQAENNIPVVGKEQVARSREMHWLRIDAYFRGAAANPESVHFMPVPCMHCENAPCEPVCPVHATVHSSEGLNDMVYNRCVGTRYCANNCPYKVRRFNFLLYQDWDTPSLKMVRNPEVTVRSRGVMEKCTFCVQRIEYAKIEAEKEERLVRDGEIVTACQAACPTEAIVFGNLGDPEAKVTKMQHEPRNYGLLAELNTRPRTTYLAAVRNPNPALSEA